MAFNIRIPFISYFFLPEHIPNKYIQTKYVLRTAFLLLLSITAGCAITPESTHPMQDQIQYVLQMQEKQIENQNNMRHQLEKLEKTLQELDQKVSEELANLNEPMPYFSSGRSYQPSSYGHIDKTSLMETQERFETSLDTMSLKTEESFLTIMEIQEKIDRLESASRNTENQAGVPLKKTIEKFNNTENLILTKLPENISPQNIYDQAFEAFDNMEFQKSLDLWVQMTHHFPNHQLAPNAFFWQGESCYQMQDFEAAILKYEKVIKHHKASNKYPSALLKQGLSYFALNKPVDGRLQLQEILEKFPDGPEATRAKLFLNKR